MTVYLSLPVYLAQWYAYEQHRLSGTLVPGYRYDVNCSKQTMEIIETRRGSVERAVFVENLTKQPKLSMPAKSPAAFTLRLAIPWTKDKPPVTYNTLSRRGERSFEDVVRMRFRKDLYLWMERHYDGGKRGVQLQDAIADYMAEHGIADTDQNYEAVKQQYRRQRDVYRKLSV